MSSWCMPRCPVLASGSENLARWTYRFPMDTCPEQHLDEFQCVILCNSFCQTISGIVFLLLCFSFAKRLGKGYMLKFCKYILCWTATMKFGCKMNWRSTSKKWEHSCQIQCEQLRQQKNSCLTLECIGVLWYASVLRSMVCYWNGHFAWSQLTYHYRALAHVLFAVIMYSRTGVTFISAKFTFL